MGKMKICIDYYFTADFLSKPLNLIGCHGNQKTEFVKNIKKSTPQKLYGGNFAEMFIALASTKILFLARLY